jgi:hypothetical protein
METAGSDLVKELSGVSGEDMINMLMTDKPATVVPPVIAKPQTPLAEEIKNKEIADKVLTDNALADKLAAEQKTKDAVIASNKISYETELAEATTDADKLAVKAKYEPIASEEVGFKLPELASTTSTVEDNGWKPLAKDLGFEIEADTEEEFKEKLDAHYKSKFEINLGKYNPETQLMFEFVESGGKLADLMEPLKPLYDLKNLTPIERIYKDLEGRKFTPELIEKEIALLTENDEIDLYDHKLCEVIDKMIESEQNVLMKKKLDATTRNDAFKQHISVKEMNDTKAAILATKEFMTIPLPQKVAEVVTKNLESGKYNSLIKDPKVMAEFAYFVELKQQAIEQIEARTALKYKSDRHNLPPLPTAGGAAAVAATQTGVQAEGNWGALDNFFNQDN